MAGRRPKVLLAGGLAGTSLLGVVGQDAPSWLVLVAVVVGVVLAIYGATFVFVAMVTVLMILSSDRRSRNLERVIAVAGGRRLRRLLPARSKAPDEEDEAEAPPTGGAGCRPLRRPSKPRRRWLRGITKSTTGDETSETAPDRRGPAPASRPGRLDDVGNVSIRPTGRSVPVGAGAKEPNVTPKPKPRWRRVLKIVLGVSPFVIPPVFAVSPEQLKGNAGNWIGLVFAGSVGGITRTVVLVVASASISVFVTRLVVTRQQVEPQLVPQAAPQLDDLTAAEPQDDLTAVEPQPQSPPPQLDYLAPEVRNGVPEQAPREIEERVVRILDDIEASGDVGCHDIRLVVLTGQYSLNYLNNIARTYNAKSNWTVRVLILDPASPQVELLAEGTKANIEASLSLLASMRAAADMGDWRIKLQWRVYPQLPAVRGYLIDDDHLFLGLTAWSGLERLPRVDLPHLHTQGRRIAHVTARNQFGLDAIASFKTWFDYQWAYATRDVEPEA